VYPNQSDIICEIIRSIEGCHKALFCPNQNFVNWNATEFFEHLLGLKGFIKDDYKMEGYLHFCDNGEALMNELLIFPINS
jgi:hypothetical protein